jgi:thiol:disulfide interchange protein DsbD
MGDESCRVWTVCARAFFAVLALVLFCGVARARADERTPVEAEWRRETTATQDTRTLALDVRVRDGWHVNAHDPNRPYLIATELAVEPPPGATVAAIDYPEAVLRSLRFAPGEPLRLYEGRFTIGVKLSGAATGPVTGRLRYQACNDETCLPPRTLAVSMAAAPPVMAAAPPVAGTATAAPPEASSRIERWMQQHGLLPTLALALLFGLALNLTPCVYPLISVTIAYFGGQSRSANGRVLGLAAAYVLGIALTFSALGVTAALSGGLFGAAMQRPVVLAGIAAVLVALAASNFGLYQLRMPTALASRTGKASAGIAGALAMGLTMGIVAAPCVGPVVIALLLFVAARHDALLGFALFFALAIGMGLPYLALAAAAGSIRRLPRSGEWLTWVEHLFGCVLLGMALYFAAPLLGASVVAVATPLLIAGAGLYLGFVDGAGSALPRFAVARRVLGVLAVVAAIWSATSPHAESTLPWEPFSPETLARAAQSGKPALVDFTAKWCLPCGENDRVTFADRSIAAEAERFVMLRADVTEMTPDREEWMQRFKVLGVPTIVLFGRGGAEEAREVGFVEPERLLGLMRERR